MRRPRRTTFTPGTDVRRELTCRACDHEGKLVLAGEPFVQVRVSGALDVAYFAVPTVPAVVEAAVRHVLQGRTVPLRNGEIVVPGADVPLAPLPDRYIKAWVDEIVDWQRRTWLECQGCDLLPDGWAWLGGEHEALVVPELPIQPGHIAEGLVTLAAVPWASRPGAGSASHCLIRQHPHGGWGGHYSHAFGPPLGDVVYGDPRVHPSPDTAALAVEAIRRHVLHWLLDAARARRDTLESPHDP